jgi:serine phosphatase RsbU (regulator of sigma subunit)/pSer/pThr/pTyr-binding forkhead associated (FHA) protein
MPSLLTVIKGPNAGRRYPLDDRCTVIGRQPDAAIYLESLAVSRSHAQITCEDGVYYVQDIGSSNGTYVNGHRIVGRVPLTDRDTVQIGPYELGLVVEPPSGPSAEPAQVIRARVDAQASNHTLFAQNPGHKLQLMLQIAHDLGHTLDLDPLLGRLLEHLLRLFPPADRGMALLCEGDRLVVRAQRTRYPGEAHDFPYSRTIVRRALEEGAGLLSEDVRGDRNLVLSATLVSLNLRSFLCVPLLGWEGRRLGVIQLDCLRAGQAFRPEDLEMLTAISLQAAVVLQNAAYHAERLREERLRQEILLARDIQQQFLPSGFELIGKTAELFARCLPAREVSGDLYDFFRLADGRLAFFVGDVSGKGMPAALFMIAVRSLARHLAPSATGAADFLQRLNTALANDNPTHLFVTMMFGIYDSKDGSVLLANGGHPPPLLRRADGQVEVVPIKPGLLLGSAPVPLRACDTRVELRPGETLILYTDGYVEGTAPDGKTEFGVDRLREALGGPRTAMSLEQCMVETSLAVRRFTCKDELEDDQTLLLLRRR